MAGWGGGGLLNSLAGLSHLPPSRVFHTVPFHRQLDREAAGLRRLAGPSGPVPALTCWVPFSEEHRGAVAPDLRREGCAGESREHPSWGSSYSGHLISIISGINGLIDGPLFPTVFYK